MIKNTISGCLFLLLSIGWFILSFFILLFFSSWLSIEIVMVSWLVGGLLLLAATLLLGVNPSGYGPRLWLGALGLYLQPSELLKLLMIVYVASYLAERRGLILSETWRIGRLRIPPVAYVGPIAAMFSLALIILAWQQDLGAAMLFFVTFLGMLYLATGQWTYPVAGLVLLLVLGAAGYAYSDLVRLRVDTWWHPWPEASGRAFQVVQSLQAYGAGGILGEGLGLGSPSLIPAVHTDFVHAAVAEELGLLGAIAVVCLYGVLMYRGFRASSRARSAFSQLLAGGITIGFTVQAWVIMAGNAKLAPITGVTLPFVSYGGSSLFASSVALGLLLRVSATGASTDHVVATVLVPADKVSHRVRLQKLAGILSCALIILAVTCGYWAIVRSSYLGDRDDNVRRLISAQRTVRGAILDRDGQILADVAIGADGLVTRRYLVPDAAPAVGYASLRYGSAGIEDALEKTLTGEGSCTPWRAWWDDQLHRPLRGAAVQLTLDSGLQSAAQRLMEHVRGAVVLLNAHSGEVLVLASSPSYDPNLLDDDWAELAEDPASPLLDRAAQGLYQPGTLIYTVVLAEALTVDKAVLDSAPGGIWTVFSVDGADLACSPGPTAPITLAEAYARGCPGPIDELAARLGADGLVEAFRRWELDTAPSLEIASESVQWELAPDDSMALSREALGQGSLVLSPLRIALITAALGADGEMPTAHLVHRVRDTQGGWQAVARPDGGRLVVSPEVAKQILAAWETADRGRIRAHAGTAVAGKDQPPHAWYSAVSTVAGKVYAVAVLVEHAADRQLASAIGLELLKTALAP